MLLRLNGDVRVEDRWNHSLEIVEELRGLLAAGADAVADPHRKDFYEVDNGFRVFYIHICPSGKVLLLAVWSKELHIAAAPATYFRAASSA